MNLQANSTDEYLSACDVINKDHSDVVAKAAELRSEYSIATVRNCFEFVRDDIQHSSDFQRNPITCRASDVLLHATGYCYAKSHLLAALLRANGIPCGLCYQRLSIDGEGPPFSLHGLNAVYLAEWGWYRVDARGNRVDVNAQFAPPREQLAFPIQMEGESDFPQVLLKPLDVVVQCLEDCQTWEEVICHLPDQLSL